MTLNGIKKFTKDIEEIALKLNNIEELARDMSSSLLIQINNLKVVEEMNNEYPEKDSRDPAYLTKWMQEKVKLMIERYNLENSPKRVIITCTFRNPIYQKKLFKKGRLFGKIIGDVVTYCDGYEKVSRHNTIPAEAVDFAIILDNKCIWDDAEFDTLGKIGEDLGLVWGGRFNMGDGRKDRPHFQQPENV